MKDKKPRIEEWWMDDQINLVMDKTRKWELKPFKSTAGIWLPTDKGSLLGRAQDHKEIPDGAVIDNNSWDHEHCELCFETISDKGDYQRVGYTDGKSWLCVSCYTEYIESQKSSNKS